MASADLRSCRSLPRKIDGMAGISIYHLLAQGIGSLISVTSVLVPRSQLRGSPVSVRIRRPVIALATARPHVPTRTRWSYRAGPPMSANRSSASADSRPRTRIPDRWRPNGATSGSSNLIAAHSASVVGVSSSLVPASAPSPAASGVLVPPARTTPAAVPGSCTGPQTAPPHRRPRPGTHTAHPDDHLHLMKRGSLRS